MTKLLPRPVPDPDSARVVDNGPVDSLPRPEPIAHLPIVILNPHNRCNCRCVMCNIWQFTSREEIAVAELDTWTTEWRELGVERIVLSGGEPLMHSRIAQLCGHIRDAGFGITILSTGLLLRRHAPVVARLCDDVIVSLDGPPLVHNRIRRVPRAFELLADGVRAIKSENRAICISARCTVQRQNHDALCETVVTAQDLGLDRISFLAVSVTGEAFHHPEGWDPEQAGELTLGSEELVRLDDEITRMEIELAEPFRTGFIAESPGKLRRRLWEYFAALRGQGEFPPVRCNAPWVSTVIETDGTVRPCFFQPPVGNVREAGSLSAVLHSESAVAWRKGLDTARDEICRRCTCSLALRYGAPAPL